MGVIHLQVPQEVLQTVEDAGALRAQHTLSNHARSAHRATGNIAIHTHTVWGAPAGPGREAETLAGRHLGANYWEMPLVWASLG